MSKNKIFFISILITLLLALGAVLYVNRDRSREVKPIDIPSNSGSAPTYAVVRNDSLLDYSLPILKSWGDYTLRSEPKGNKTLRKGDYVISIAQDKTKQSRCVYPNDIDLIEPYAKFSNFQDFTNASGSKFRRSWNGELKNATQFIICEFTDNGWQQLTEFGNITFSTAGNNDPIILSEMDEIVKSISKK